MMKLKPFLFFAIAFLALAGCSSNELNNGGSDSSMLDSALTDSTNVDSTSAKPTAIIDSTRLEAPVH